MDLRQLRYFCEIAAHANFNRAAKQLRIAQPALSRQIHKLEEELGVALFSRVGRGVVLTRAGKVLAEHSNFLLKQAERAREAVLAEATVPQGTAALGAPPSIGHTLFGPIAEQYASSFPRVTLRLVEGMTHNLLELLRDGQIDLAIITLPDPLHATILDKTLAAPTLISEDMMVFGPRGDKRIKSEFHLKDLQGLPLILTGKPNMARVIIENAASANNVALNVKLEVESLYVMKELVTRGMGYGITPCTGLYGQHRTFRTSVISGLKLVRAVAYQADRPPSVAVTKLLGLVNQALDNLAQKGIITSVSTLTNQSRPDRTRAAKRLLTDAEYRLIYQISKAK